MKKIVATVITHLIIISILVGIMPMVQALDPSPYISVQYPYGVYSGEKAIISVEVNNYVDASNEGYISISFPDINDEDISEVSGTGNKYNKLFPKHSLIANSTGQEFESINPLVELRDTDWGANQKETINMTVNVAHDAVFYVRDVSDDYRVKFEGTAITDETNEPWRCYGSYYFDVCVDKILIDKMNTLQYGVKYRVATGEDPKNIKSDDKVEVYGIHWFNSGPLQCVGMIEASCDPYYVKKIDHTNLIVTEISFSSDFVVEKKPVTITANVMNNGNYGESNVYVVPQVSHLKIKTHVR